MPLLQKGLQTAEGGGYRPVSALLCGAQDQTQHLEAAGAFVLTLLSSLN
jgi:hypothetical protein